MHGAGAGPTSKHDHSLHVRVSEAGALISGSVLRPPVGYPPLEALEPCRHLGWNATRPALGA